MNVNELQVEYRCLTTRAKIHLKKVICVEEEFKVEQKALDDRLEELNKIREKLFSKGQEELDKRKKELTNDCK